MSLLSGRTVVERPDTSGGSRGGLVPLLVIVTAQLMLVLDDSIVNIALPSIQRELEVSAVHLPWDLNAYILAFGALLLLGGRIGDLWGASSHPAGRHHRLHHRLPGRRPRAEH